MTRRGSGLGSATASGFWLVCLLFPLPGIIGSRAAASRTSCGRRCAAGLRPVLDPACPLARTWAAARERGAEAGSPAVAALAVGWLRVREWLSRRAGAQGCEPAALVTEPSPVALPGPPGAVRAAARRAPARSTA